MAKRTITPEPRSAQEKSLSFRQLKVRKGYYPYPFNPKHPHLSPKPVPWVQIKSYWLNQVGFTIGTQITVQIQQGCIVLKAQPSTR
ncbi:MAG: SymE family type I addiction module toxin [Pseudomonadales bacterium]